MCPTANFNLFSEKTVTISSAKYLYTIEVIYPISKNASFTFADSTLTSGNGLAFTYVVGKTVNSSGSSYQIKNVGYTYPVFSVARDCTVVISGHDGTYGYLNVFVNGVKSTVEMSSTGTYTIAAKANDVITVKLDEAHASNSYIKAITVTYA